LFASCLIPNTPLLPFAPSRCRYYGEADPLICICMCDRCRHKTPCSTTTSIRLLVFDVVVCFYLAVKVPPSLRTVSFVWDFALRLFTRVAHPAAHPLTDLPLTTKRPGTLPGRSRRQLEYPVLGFILLSARPRRSSNRVYPVVFTTSPTARFAVERYITDVRRRCQTRTQLFSQAPP